MTPNSFKIMFGQIADLALDDWDGTFVKGPTVAASDRFEVHLPGFGGAYNSFGALHGTVVPAYALVGDADNLKYEPSTNGITALKSDGTQLANVIKAAEWDSAREVLKLTARAAGNFQDIRGVELDRKYLHLHEDVTDLPSGLGPLPPNGGIDSNWYNPAPCTQDSQLAADFIATVVQVLQSSIPNPPSGTRWRGCAGTHPPPVCAMVAATGRSASVNPEPRLRDRSSDFLPPARSGTWLSP
jgi:hypothetical protein